MSLNQIVPLFLIVLFNTNQAMYFRVRMIHLRRKKKIKSNHRSRNRQENGFSVPNKQIKNRNTSNMKCKYW